MTLVCDGCGSRIGEADQGAARRVPLGGGVPPILADWCGECVKIIRLELPRIAATARQARTAAPGPADSAVQRRARNLWGERNTGPQG